ncbi:MAG TPA: sigma-70 family RNA polymerase sigma factor [Solirubrobacteraceae bacterium]|nr:sigma-70 family RNA polymerase sigma factor [Solirubrobacteraceae bacterium]
MAHELTSTPAAPLTSPRRARRRITTPAPVVGRRVRGDAFERLFEENAASLFSFLAYRTGDRVLAEDLLSETFERVLRSRVRFDPRRGSERRWLYTIALNLLRDHARRRTHEERLLRTACADGGEQRPDPALAAVEHRDELARALATLCEAEREALALRFGADLKLREVARILGEGESAVEGRIYRALRKLRDELERPAQLA